MLPQENARTEISVLWRQAANERRRAARAAAVAARHHAQAGEAAPSLRPLHMRMEELNRQVEARHLATASIVEFHAIRMERWLNGAAGEALRPVFMAGVAAVLGAPSAAATLRGHRHAAVAVAASDTAARAAHELELVMAEGPAKEAMEDGAAVQAAGPAIQDRWPRYGPALAGLGLRAVLAVPLGQPGTRIGALCVYDREPVLHDRVRIAAETIADALTDLMLEAARTPAPEGAMPALAVFDGADDREVVHQAAGMVSVQCGCGVDDAEDLLAARAFASESTIEHVALQVVSGQTRFC